MATQNNIIVNCVDECKLNEIYNDLNELKKDLQNKLSNQNQIDCSSYYNQDTTVNQSNRDVVDDFQSHHYYDKNGLSSDNLQYLQLDAVSNMPTSLASAVNACYYEDENSSYMYGVSSQSLYYSGIANSADLNRCTKREIFNILQDINSMDETFKDASGNVGYKAFKGIWNQGFINKNDKLPTGIANRLGMAEDSIAQKMNGSEDTWAWGNYCIIWRYDINTKKVIARSVVNMNRELDPNGDWLVSTAGRGPVTSFGDGRFCVSVPNASTNGVLVFDKNLKPIANVILSSYDTFGPVKISATNFEKRGQQTFGINQDQYNSLFVKKWSREDLKGIEYKSLLNGSVVDVFGNEKEAVFMYLSSSSQGQYSALEATGSYIHQGIMTPLADYKWNQSSGKVIQYALCKNALGKWRVEPVGVFYTCPDPYKPGDILQPESFITNPDTNEVQPLKVLYPLVDNRDSVIDIGSKGNYRNANVWREPYRQTKFTDGTNNTVITAGLQALSVNIFDISGDNLGLGIKGSSCFYQDVYATPYKRNKDNNNEFYYQQNDLNMGQIVILDPDCRFYPSSNPKKYIDLSNNLTFTDDGTGVYKNNGNLDKNVNAESRAIINNNGFGKRYMFSPYQLDTSANGIAIPHKLFNGNSTNSMFSDISANMNPLPPPFNTNGFSSNNKNTGAQHIKPNFYFSNNHVFDSTATYLSRPWSLSWSDQRIWSGNYDLNAASNGNPDYGKTKLLNANDVKEFFRLCQTAQGEDASKHVVQVLTRDDLLSSNYKYNDLSGEVTLPENHIVFKVKGEVLACQPIIMTIPFNLAGNLVLGPILANQLSYYGSGIYGKVSLIKDDNNRTHMFGGGANTNYIPLSEMFYCAEYSCNRIKQEMIKLFNNQPNELPLTVETATKLGYDNVDWNTQPSFDDNYYATSYKTAIRDRNGRILISTTLRGMNDWYLTVSRYTAGEYADNTSKMLDFNGNILQYKTDIASTITCQFPVTGPKGIRIKLTGNEYKEVADFRDKIFQFRGLAYSPRSNRLISARPWCIDPRTMMLEHVVVSKLDNVEIFGVFFRDYHKLTPDTLLVDNGINRDEVHGVVTCGSNLIGSASKTNVRTFRKEDLNSKTLMEIGGIKQYPNDPSRKNFAITQYTSLGRTFGTSSKVKYGSSSLYIAFNTAASIGGANSYLGKLNGRDIFVDCLLSGLAASGYVPYNVIPILPNVTYNNFDNIRNAVKSDDGRAWILAPTQPLVSVPEVHRNQAYKIMCAYTQNDNGETVPLWLTALPNYNYPVLAQRVNGNYGSSIGGLPIVNDLILFNGGPDMFIVKAQTGEILAKFRGNDFDYDEINGRDIGYLGRSELQHIGQVNYAKGYLHLLMGQRRLLNNISAWGRSIGAMTVKKNSKLNMPYSLFGCGSNSVDVVFKHEDTNVYNNNKFILITTFLTTDRYGNLIAGYPNVDLSYNMLYHSGITAIAIDASSDLILSKYNNSSVFNDKFVNGGSYYAARGVSFNDIKNNILFLYAGQIPYNCAKQTPFFVSDKQVLEAKQVRNQKLLLSEYNRIKNGNTYPYPDNGYMFGGDTRTAKTYATGAGTNDLGYQPLNTIKYNKYYNGTNDSTLNSYNPSFNPFNWNASLPAESQIWNQPLGYTDIGIGRPFANKPGYDQYGNPL